MPSAKTAAARAVELDDNLAEAHIALAFVATCDFEKGFDTELAEREFKRAIELNPDSVLAHRWYAVFLAEERRFDQAISEIKRTLEIEPLSAISSRFFGHILYLAGRYDEAIDQCQKALELDPNFISAYRWLAKSYEMKGMFDQSFATQMKSYALSGKDPKELESLKRAYAASNWKGYCEKRLEQNKERMKRSFVDPSYLAQDYLRIGQKDEAIKWLEKAVYDHSSWMPELKAEPIWDGLRSDRRFTELLRRIYLRDNFRSS